MMKAKILLVEGKRADHPSYESGLVRKGFQVEIATSGAGAVARLSENTHNLVVVDASSMRTSGKRICQAVRQQAPTLPIVLLVHDASDAQDRKTADVILVQPFTLQKLVNRIRPLLPVEHKDFIQVGPLQLDPEQRRVRCQDRQNRLTPRMVALLKILMEHPGEVLERTSLFSQVWDTDYTEDTRTLDVHISWLREAIEIDPRHPQYLKTIRGVGYRLDIEEEPATTPLRN